MWAQSLIGHETDSAFLLLEATDPLRIGGPESQWPTGWSSSIMSPTTLTLHLEQEEDGRWIADVSYRLFDKPGEDLMTAERELAPTGLALGRDDSFPDPSRMI